MLAGSIPAMSESAASPRRADVIDTLQSLIVAFVVAMAFRGFVLEGFMIPTGSMGPTLMGAHVLVRSPVTGYEYAADTIGIDGRARLPIIDPMVSRRFPVEAVTKEHVASRVAAGDRVLVLKYLWPLLAPERWDVVVFKNPPDPVGETQNYIKRLVGMPNETLLLLDGDVFVGPPDSPSSALRIARKPEMVQRAVWQPVYDSDWQPTDLARWQEAWRQPWSGPPWKPHDDGAWTMDDARIWRHASPTAGSLEWDLAAHPITDWNSYNLWRQPLEFPVADVRVAGALEIDSPASLTTSLLLRARSHRFEFAIGSGKASLRVVREEDGGEVGRAEAPLPSLGRFATVDFWHVDQAMRLFVDDVEVVSLEYDLGAPEQRLALARVNLDRHRLDPSTAPPQGIAELAWRFEGSAVSVRHLRLDRDLYYQPLGHTPQNQYAMNGPVITGIGFACDPAHPAQLRDEQFLMLGDNSAASRDGRLWGRPHPLLKREFGFDAPFVVPRPLLVGKAWCVYFPATSKLGAGIDGTTADDKTNSLP
ncbi:MAG: hypothetical protein FJ253_10145, partial [Phycisphaerae bacterium]|nr:hypothetical protein [Phycisphaerae bacterium]